MTFEQSFLFGLIGVLFALLIWGRARCFLRGAVEIVARYVVSPERGLPAHIGIMSLVGAGLSAVIKILRRWPS